MDFLTDSAGCDSLLAEGDDSPPTAQSLPHKHILEQRAKQFRNRPTYHESLFLSRIGPTDLDYKFQVVVGLYIVDFVLPKKMVVIEIDGDSHLEQKDYDERRTARLRSFGFKVIRIYNSKVKEWPLSELLELPDVPNPNAFTVALARADESRKRFLEMLKNKRSFTKKKNRRRKKKNKLPPKELPGLIFKAPRKIKIIKKKNIDICPFITLLVLTSSLLV